MILYERLPTFCYHYGLIGQGASNCCRRLGNSPPDQVMEDAAVVAGGDLAPGSGLEVSQIGQVATGNAATNDQIASPGEDQSTDFGAWMIATRRRNRGRNRGGAGFSPARDSHVRQLGRSDVSTTVRSLRGDPSSKAASDDQHVVGRGSEGGVHGGLRSRGGGRGGLSSHASDRSSAYVAPDTAAPAFETNAAPAPAFETFDAPLLQATTETSQLELCAAQGSSKTDKKGKEL